MTALVDTNVFLDAILQRIPFSTDSEKVLAASEIEAFEGYCCATSLTDIFYIVRKELGVESARKSIETILRTARVAPVNRTTISGALDPRFTDFEDGVICEAAREIGASCIVTRNLSDFTASHVPAMTPSDFLEILKEEKQ